MTRGLTCFSLCALCTWATSLARAQTASVAVGAKPSFEALLQRTASAPPDWCADSGDDSGKTDEMIFESAAADVVDALNEQSAARAAQSEDWNGTVRDVLATFNEASSRIDSSWPVESRFRAEALSVS